VTEIENRTPLLLTDRNAAPRSAASWEPPVELVKSPWWLLGSVLVGAGGVSLLFHASDVDLNFRNDFVAYCCRLLLWLPGAAVVFLALCGVGLWREVAIPKGSRADIVLKRIGAAQDRFEAALDWPTGSRTGFLLVPFFLAVGAGLLWAGIGGGGLEEIVIGGCLLIFGLFGAVAWWLDRAKN